MGKAATFAEKPEGFFVSCTNTLFMCISLAMKYSSKTVCAAEVLAVKNTFSQEWERDFSFIN